MKCNDKRRYINKLNVMTQVETVRDNLRKMCRLCLKSEVQLRDIFSFSSNLGEVIADVIMKCAPVQLNKNDELPNHICSPCYIQLVKTQQFQAQVIKSDRILRCNYQQLNSVDRKAEFTSSQFYENSDDQNSIQCDEVCFNYSNSDENCFTLISKIDDNIPKIQNNSNQTENITMKYEETEISPSDTIITCIKTENVLTDPLTGWEVTEKGFADSEINVSDYKSEINWDEHSNLNTSDEKVNIIGDTCVNEICIKQEICNTAFVSTRSDRKKPEYKINNKNSHQCNVCYITFTQASHLNSHKCVCTDEKPYGENFTQLSNLKSRKCVHTSENQLQCNIRKNTYTQSSHLNSHKRTHSGTKPYKCDICHKAFTRAFNFSCHKLTHSGVKPFVCNVCNKTFIRSDSLNTHKLTHSGEKPFECDVCNKTFIRLNNLNTHKIIHTREKPYQCDICSKTFTHSGHLNCHKRTHTGEKPYQCHVCSKTFSQLCNLKHHKRIHTDENRKQCDVCNKTFPRICSLNKHKLLHTGEKPYQCDICSKTFTHSGQLNCHKRTHTGEKPYACDICDKAFAQSGNLKSHKRIHTGEKS